MSWFVAYQSPKGCVSWQGHGVKEDDECRDFLQGLVAARLHDAKGYATLVEHLNGLSLAGMGQSALEAVLAAEVPEERDWVAGEALAEAVLEAQHDVVLPWTARVRSYRAPKGARCGSLNGRWPRCFRPPSAVIPCL